MRAKLRNQLGKQLSCALYAVVTSWQNSDFSLLRESK
jgi:hypothetical protein